MRRAILADQDALHAVFEIGRMPNPFGSGDGPLNIVYTKAGLESRIRTKRDASDVRLVLYDVLLNWPDDETENKE